MSSVSYDNSPKPETVISSPVKAIRVTRENVSAIIRGLPGKAKLALSAAVHLPKGSLTIRTPEGSNTRPTSDRARESLFNVLAHADWRCVVAQP